MKQSTAQMPCDRVAPKTRTSSFSYAHVSLQKLEAEMMGKCERNTLFSVLYHVLTTTLVSSRGFISSHTHRTIEPPSKRSSNRGVSAVSNSPNSCRESRRKEVIIAASTSRGRQPTSSGFRRVLVDNSSALPPLSTSHPHHSVISILLHCPAIDDSSALPRVLSRSSTDLATSEKSWITGYTTTPTLGYLSTKPNQQR